MSDWSIPPHAPAWIDTLLWVAGAALGGGGSIALVHLVPGLPLARFDLKRLEGDMLVADIEAMQEHNRRHTRRKVQVKNCLILTCGGFAVLFLQILKHSL